MWLEIRDFKHFINNNLSNIRKHFVRVQLTLYNTAVFNYEYSYESNFKMQILYQDICHLPLFDLPYRGILFLTAFTIPYIKRF